MNPTNEGPFHGLDAIRDGFERCASAFEELGTAHLRGRVSGIERDQPSAVIVDDGPDQRIMRIRIYADVDAALEAAGLGE